MFISFAHSHIDGLVHDYQTRATKTLPTTCNDILMLQFKYNVLWYLATLLFLKMGLFISKLIGILFPGAKHEDVS